MAAWGDSIAMTTAHSKFRLLAVMSPSNVEVLSVEAEGTDPTPVASWVQFWFVRHGGSALTAAQRAANSQILAKNSEGLLAHATATGFPVQILRTPVVADRRATFCPCGATSVAQPLKTAGLYGVPSPNSAVQAADLSLTLDMLSGLQPHNRSPTPPSPLQPSASHPLPLHP